MKKILVTGAGGYIGSIVAKNLLEKGYKVLAVDNFSKGYEKPLILLSEKFGKDSLKWFKKDLVLDNLDGIFEEIDAVLHFAGFCDVGQSWEKPYLYFGNNVIGTQRLAEAAIKAKIDKFIFSSTCAIYGDAKYVPIDEKHPIGAPSSPYGQSKKICEEILDWYSKTGFIKYVFLRYFNVTGASDDGKFGDSKNPSFQLVQNAVRGALGIAKFELNYATVSTPDGSPIRDFLNVEDLVEAHILALKYLEEKNESNIFNLGTGRGNSVLEIVRLIKEKTGVDFEVGEAGKRRRGEADRMIADYSKAQNLLDWKPAHTLEQSIETLIVWYKNHPKGWEK